MVRKTASLGLSAALALTCAGKSPAWAAETLSRVQTRLSPATPLPALNAPLVPGLEAPGLEKLAALPSFNSIDAQAIGAASLLAPTAHFPSAASPAPAVPGLAAAIEATAREAVAASAQLAVVEGAALTQPTASPAAGKAALDQAWTRTGAWAASEASPLELKSEPRRLPLSKAARAAAGAVIGGAALLDSSIALASPKASAAASAAPALLPHWLQGVVTLLSPWLTVAAAAGIIYGVNRAVQAIIAKVAKAGGWEKNTAVVVKRAASLGIWGLGAVISLQVGGAPPAVVTAVAGLGSTAVTMASKQILGNALEASKVLLNHSFVKGDRLKLGEDVYEVKDLSLRYVSLLKEGMTSPLNFTYLQLAAMPLTVLRPYEAAPKLKLEKPTVSLAQGTRLAGKAIGSGKRKTWLWLLGGVAVAVGATYAAPIVGIAAVTTALAYLKGVAVLVIAHNARAFILDFIQLLSDKAGWHPQTTLVIKLIAEVASYGVGASLALSAAGTSMLMVFGGLGTTTLAFTLVTQDILSTLVSAAWLMSDRSKDKGIRIGQHLLVGKVFGKVLDMNFQYVVLDHENGTHTLVSYSYIKDNPFQIVSDEDLPAVKAKHQPPQPKPVEVKLGSGFDAGGYNGTVAEIGPDYLVLDGGSYRTVVPFSALKERGLKPLLPSAAPDPK